MITTCPQLPPSRRPTLNFSISVPSQLGRNGKSDAPSLQAAPEQKQLLDKIARIPLTNRDKLHPQKNEASNHTEYVEEGLWKTRVTYQKDPSFSVSMSQLRAKSAELSQQPIPTLDAICEEELRRRFPDFRLIKGVKAAIKDKFPILSKWVMGKTKFDQELTQKEVDTLKKQISFSACDRDDLVSTPIIEDPHLRDALQLKEDAILETHHLFAKNSPMNGKVFERDGKIIHLSQGLACSSDRKVENTSNLRLVQTKNKESICYTGRPDSDRKALEQASFIFLNELRTQRKGITQTKDPQGNITYQLDFVVNSLLSAPWLWSVESPLTAFPEREYIENEIKALITLRNKGFITIEDPNCPGAKYQVKFNPIFFSRSCSALNRIENWLPPFVTGESRAREISEEGLASLTTLARQKLTELKDSPQQKLKIKKIQSSLQTLERHQRENHLLPEEELLVRDYLCKLLELPEVFHCKSSLDRTSVPVALSSALKQWMELGLPEPDSIFEILKDFRFKELFACNWMVGHQITRYACNRKGTVAGEKIKTKILGFTLHRGTLQNPSIINLLPERYLKPFPTHEKAKIYICYALSLGIMLLVYLPLLLLTAVRNLAYLVTLGKNRHWMGPWKFSLPILPLTLIFNFTSIIPDKVLNEDSPQVGERNILVKKS
jgi:hypothetical protein